MISKQEQPQEQRQWQSTKAATDNDNNNNNNEVLVEPPHPTDLEYQLSTPPPALNEASQQKVQTLLEQIMWLDMIEVHLLTQLVHVKMGGHWSDLQGSGSGTNIQSNNKNKAQTDDEDEDAQPKSLLQDVKLVSFDAKAKLKVIKEIRTIIPGLGLKEAKELVEVSTTARSSFFVESRTEQQYYLLLVYSSTSGENATPRNGTPHRKKTRRKSCVFPTILLRTCWLTHFFISLHIHNHSPLPR